MFHGLSRWTLNILIIVCLLIIVVIHFANQTNENQPLQPLELPPLPEQQWHRWQTYEGVEVSWQTHLSDSLVVAIATAKGTERFSVSSHDWTAELQTSLKILSKNKEGALVLLGPLNKEDMRNAAAFVINKIGLRAVADGQKNTCRDRHPAGAVWWEAQGTEPTAAFLEEGFISPIREDWQAFRSKSAVGLREQWLNPESSVDIQLQVTYHQWPADYVAKLYQGLALSQKEAPLRYAECLTQ